MLLEKLENANRQARQARIRFLLIFVSCAAIVALFLLGIVTIDLSRLGFGPGANETAELRQSPASRQLSERDQQTTGTPALNEERHSEEVNQVNSGPETLTSTSEPTLADDEAKAAAREKFKQALAIFESQLEPEVASDAFTRWNSARQREVLDKRDQAVSEFTKGDYGTAVSSLEDASALARNELMKRDSAFDAALADANSAYEADDYETASLKIAEALRLKPQSLEAREAEKAIEGLPPLLALIEKAGVARTENNLEAEKTHLEAALALDPSRQQLSARLKAVSSELRERAFSRHIDQGMAALDRKDLASAYKSLENARAIFKGRPEAKLLSAQAAVLARKLEFERLMTQARNASQSDDWRAAGAFYRQAGDLFPGNAEAVNGAALSAQITSLTTQLSKHIQAPQRLASGNVAQLARGLVAEARPLSDYSSSLKVKAEKLSALLDAYAVKVQVRVVSDGETSISVRGVGRVGKTESKTIELRPGRHTFEGIRQGYRAKLIEVQIPPGAENFVVEIYCDERI